MISDPRFWVGIAVGVVAYIAWMRYQASKAG